jgi:hypothetical protein
MNKPLQLTPFIQTLYIPQAEFYTQSILLRDELPEDVTHGKYDFSANNRVILKDDGIILAPVSEPAVDYFYSVAPREKRAALKEEKEHQNSLGNRQLYVLQLAEVKKLSYHANAMFSIDADIHYSSPNLAFYRAIHADTAPTLRLDAGWLLSKTFTAFLTAHLQWDGLHTNLEVTPEALLPRLRTIRRDAPPFRNNIVSLNGVTRKEFIREEDLRDQYLSEEASSMGDSFDSVDFFTRNQR